MAKNLELISDYYKYQAGSKFLTSVAAGSILMGTTLSPVPSSAFVALGCSVIGVSIGTIINLKDDLALINEMKKIYDEIIRHYNELNEEFDFDDPVQMFALYVYMLKKGYLSLHQEYQYGEPKKEIHGLLGAEVIMGKGVCRHTSAMLSDIFNDNEIISRICHGFLSDDGEMLCSANHTVVTAEKDGMTYLLDPTNSLTFQATDTKAVYVCKDGFIYLNPFERLKISHCLDFTSIEENKEVMKKTLKICSRNKDVLESFYRENKNLYEEMANKKQEIQRYFR